MIISRDFRRLVVTARNFILALIFVHRSCTSSTDTIGLCSKSFENDNCVFVQKRSSRLDSHATFVKLVTQNDNSNKRPWLHNRKEALREIYSRLYIDEH